MKVKQAITTGAGILLVTVFSLVPLAWFFRAAVTPANQIYLNPPHLLPDTFTLEHFLTVLSDPSVLRYLANSLVFCFAATLIALALGALAAYGLARSRLRARNLMLVFLLGIHLAPSMTSVAALYRMVEAVQLLNTLTAIILIKGASLTMVVWLLKSHFEQVPVSIEEAGRLDGCEGFQLFRKIVLPLCAPGLFSAGLLLFIGNWNAFFLPYVLLTDPDKMTAAVGIYQYVGEHGFEMGKIAAMTLLSITPVLVLFAIFNKRIWKNLFLRGA